MGEKKLTADQILAVWPRVLADLKHKAFVNCDLERTLIESDPKSWADHVVSQEGPGDLLICNVPKGKGAVRPGNAMSVEDRARYSAVVYSFLQEAHAVVKWSQGEIDCGYMLDRPDREEWFRNSYQCWNAFRETSLNIIKEGYSFVVSADIAGFYECIDHETLFYVMRQYKIPDDAIASLRPILKRWFSNKGLPQACSPSDVLAKLYINTVDEGLKAAGYRHLRYVDDIRIFCRTRPEALRAIVKLTELLRTRGLIVQSAKLKINEAVKIEPEIRGAQTVITSIKDQLVKSAIEKKLFDDPSIALTGEDLEAEVAKTITPAQEVKETFSAYFSKEAESFDKTLFHFLLKRLAKIRSDFAISRCLDFLTEHPEETKEIIEYFEQVGTPAEFMEPLLGFLTSDTAVYDYQNYLILRFLARGTYTASEGLVAYARTTAFDQNRDIYLRSTAMRLLGYHGSVNDLEAIQSSYSLCPDDVSKCHAILALARMESGKRNSLLQQYEKDGYLIARACDSVRKNQL